MFKCNECEFFERGIGDEILLNCDPFSTVKGPECLARWQLLKLNQLTDYYERTLMHHERVAPMQEKMFEVMEKEIDSMSESDKWKYSDDDHEDLDSEYGDIEY